MHRKTFSTLLLSVPLLLSVSGCTVFMDLAGVLLSREEKMRLWREVILPVEQEMSRLLYPLDVLLDEAVERGDTKRAEEMAALQDEVTLACGSLRQLSVFGTGRKEDEKEYGAPAFRDAERCKETLRRVEHAVENETIPDYVDSIETGPIQ